MKIFKIAAVAMIAVTLITSCSEDETTFNIENVPGRCTLQGKIVYNQGTTYENGKFVYDYKPVANTEVTVTLENKSFGSYEGTSTFTTTTDENGNYTIAIPAPVTNISATVSTPDFITVRKVVTAVNNKIKTIEEEVVLRGWQKFDEIHSNGIVLANFRCVECNKGSIYDGYNQYARISGTIGQNAEYKVNAQPVYDTNNRLYSYDDAQLYRVFTPVSNADLIVKVRYSETDCFTYNTTTDRNGIFNLDVPVPGYPATFTYEVDVMPYNATFTHYTAIDCRMTNYYGYVKTYTDYEAHTLKGYYSQHFDAKFSANLPVSAEYAHCMAKVMLFSPLNDGQDVYGYHSYEFRQSDKWLSELLEELNQWNDN